jgi:hypothetical protein
MKETIIRKQLGLIDYSNIPQDYVYIGRLPSPFSNPVNNYEVIADFYVGEGFVINRKESRRNGAVEDDDMPEQFEMPLAGVKWMIETIELGFERPPSAGGLEKNKLSMETRIQDERLFLIYGVCVGGEGVGGYTIKNTSRSSYILPRYSQEFSITVDIWNQVGRSFFKDLLKRIEAGEFG